MTAIETCIFMNVARSTLDNWRLAGTGPTYFRANRLIRYRLSDVQAFLETHTTKTGLMTTALRIAEPGRVGWGPRAAGRQRAMRGMAGPIRVGGGAERTVIGWAAIMTALKNEVDEAGGRRAWSRASYKLPSGHVSRHQLNRWLSGIYPITKPTAERLGFDVQYIIRYKRRKQPQNGPAKP